MAQQQQWGKGKGESQRDVFVTYLPFYYCSGKFMLRTYLSITVVANSLGSGDVIEY